MQVKKNFKCLFDKKANCYVHIVNEELRNSNVPVFIRWNKLSSKILKSAKEREYVLKNCVFRMLAMKTIHSVPVKEIKNATKGWRSGEIVLIEKHLNKSPLFVQQEYFPERSPDSVRAFMNRLKKKREASL